MKNMYLCFYINMVLLTHHLKDLKLVFFHRGMDLSRVSSTYSPVSRRLGGMELPDTWKGSVSVTNKIGFSCKKKNCWLILRLITWLWPYQKYALIRRFILIMDLYITSMYSYFSWDYICPHKPWDEKGNTEANMSNAERAYPFFPKFYI